MQDTRPIPDIAKTAFRLTAREFEQRIASLGDQTVAALGFTPDDHWTVNFDTGMMTREIPDAPRPAAPVTDGGAT